MSDLLAPSGDPGAPGDPSPPEPGSGGAVCRCGRGPHADRVGFCAANHPLLGHGAALSARHGLFAAEAAEHLADARRAFLAESLTDDGGEGEVPTRRRALHEYRARLDGHIRQLSDALEAFGLFDRRGRLRATWLQRLEGLVDRARAIDATLGLARRSRPVESAADIIAEFRQRGERTP